MRKYYLNGKEKEESAFYYRLKFENEIEYGGDFNKYLNNRYGTIEIVGKKYNACDVIKKINTKGYKTEYQNYINALFKDSKEDLEKHKKVIVNKMVFELKEV